MTGHFLDRWGTVRLRMTLWNVAVLALILGCLGGVVRVKVQADRFATVDRTLAERAHSVIPQGVPPLRLGPGILSHRGEEGDGSLVGSKHALPPLPPRIIPRDPAQGPSDEPWDRHAYVRALTGRTVFSTVRDHGTPTRVLSMPIERRGKIDRVLQLVYPLDGVLREIDALTSTLLALVPIGLLAAGLGGAFLTGRALRPVRQIAATAARLGASDLSERLPVSGRDEFSALSSSINAMLARLEEAFDRQRRFTADASHELRTPLSIITANTSLALDHPWPEDRYRDFLAAIESAAGRQSRIVEELLFLARADAGGLARDVGPVCLIDVLEEAAESVSRPDRACLRRESIDPALLVLGSGSELTRLCINLLENAVRHTPPDGTVTVSAAVDATSVIVSVADTGEGIAPEHLPHLGERFYRVDAARSTGPNGYSGGNGLGLAICRSITEAHGGQMIIESQVGEGTTVRIRLPICPQGT
jgi:signal transduction histidine kinase